MRGHVRVVSAVREGDRRPVERVIAWGPWLRRVGAGVEETAEHTKLWWVTAVTTAAAAGGRRCRKAALAGVAAMTVAEMLSNGVAKQLCERRRPPRERVPPEDLRERPDSSSFPPGHTAAAVAFFGAVAPAWPAVGAACGGRRGAGGSAASAERGALPGRRGRQVAIGLAGAALGRSATATSSARTALTTGITARQVTVCGSLALGTRQAERRYAPSTPRKKRAP